MSDSPSPQDWMVLQCGACGKRMKVRRETAMSARLLCPGCRTPVPVLAETGAPGAPEAATGEAPLQPAAVPVSVSPAAARPGSGAEFSPSPLPARLAPSGSGNAGGIVLPRREKPVMQGGNFGGGPSESPVARATSGPGPQPAPAAGEREGEGEGGAVAETALPSARSGSVLPRSGSAHREFGGSLTPEPRGPRAAPGPRKDGTGESGGENSEAYADDTAGAGADEGAVLGPFGERLDTDSGPHGSGRRVRIKKRKASRTAGPRYHELTDWDQSDLAGIPEAELEADIWGRVVPIPEDVEPETEENEYVVESVEDGEGQTKTTKKKVRRRRLLLGARLFFQRFTVFSRFLIQGLAVVMIGLVIFGFYVFRQKPEEVELPPVVEPPVDRRVLTTYDEQGAEKAVRDFLAADGIGAKLAFVRQPKRVKPLMERWYRDDRAILAGPLTAGEVVMRDKKGGESGTAAYYVLLALPVHMPDPFTPGSTYEEQTFFAVEEIRNGPDSTFLVDWETSTGYQPLPLEVFKSTMPTEALPFRIMMKADDYYNHGFDPLEWQCVALYYPGREFHLYGYISRNSLEGRRMLEIVEGGSSAAIIAELAYPRNAASREQVIVKRMVHTSWFYDTEEDANRAVLPSILEGN